MGTQEKEAVQELDLHDSKEQISFEEALPREDTLDAHNFGCRRKQA